MSHQETEWRSIAAALRGASAALQLTDSDLIRTIELTIEAWEDRAKNGNLAEFLRHRQASIAGQDGASDETYPIAPVVVSTPPNQDEPLKPSESALASFTDRHTRPERLIPREEERPRDLPERSASTAQPRAERKIASFDERYSRVNPTARPNAAEESRTVARSRTPADPVTSKREREEGQPRFRTQNQPAPAPDTATLPGSDVARQAARDELERRAAAAEAEAAENQAFRKTLSTTLEPNPNHNDADELELPSTERDKVRTKE